MFAVSSRSKCVQSVGGQSVCSEQQVKVHAVTSRFKFVQLAAD